VRLSHFEVLAKGRIVFRDDVQTAQELPRGVDRRPNSHSSLAPLRSPGLSCVAGNQERKKIRDYEWVPRVASFFDCFFAAER
jgi:hypothetical protein